MNECGSVQRQNAIATENNDYAKLVHFELIESNSSSAITGQNMFLFSSVSGIFPKEIETKMPFTLGLSCSPEDVINVISNNHRQERKKMSNEKLRAAI